MTHVKALQAGHSSQGTSEPITPAGFWRNSAFQWVGWRNGGATTALPPGGRRIESGPVSADVSSDIENGSGGRIVGTLWTIDGSLRKRPGRRGKIPPYLP